MATALTLYLTNTNDTLLTNARTLIANTTGASGVGVDTLLGTATGWAEIQSHGNAGAWAALGAIGNPTGKGWIYDSTALELQAFTSGNWTPTIRVTYNGANASASVTVRFRVYKYNSGVYTLIADSSTNITITSTATTFALTAVSVGEVDFLEGDKVYCDIWADVTANSNTATGATFRLNEANSTTQGNVQEQLVTPGYNAITAVSVTDSATGGSETITFGTIAPSVSDTASGSETVTLGTITPSVSDSATGSDSATLGTIQPSVSDTASGGSETFTFNTIAPSVSDAASGSESTTLGTITPNVSDTASGSAESVTLGTIKPSVSDTASGSEAITGSTTFTLADAHTAQAFTGFFTNVASSRLATAAKLIGTGGGSSIGVDTTLGTATGIGEIYPLGTGQAWAAAGSYPALPSGHGVVWDDSTLDGAEFASGNWQPTLRLTFHNGNASITADITVRVWVLLASGGYSGVLATITLTNQTISNVSSSNYVLPSTNIPTFGLGVGDRVYVEILINVLTNPNTATNATLRCNFSNSSTTGATNSEITAPNYTIGNLAESVIVNQQFTITDADVQAGELITFAARPPISQPYNLSGVPTGGPYVSSVGSAFVVGGRIIPRLYGSTFFAATEGGSTIWQATDGSCQRFIDGLIRAYQSAGLTVMRATDQWGSNAALTWDNPAIWTNMDYLVQAAAQAGIWVQMDLSGYKSVLSAAGIYPFIASFWSDFLTAVGNHYKNVNNILFYTIAGEPTFPRHQSDVDALVSFFTSTIATLKAADPHHLCSPGGFISMNNGLAGWWQQIWAIPGVDVCCYKSYSLHDLQNAATYSQYAAFTLNKIAVQQEFGLQQYMGDGVWTGQTVNSLTMDRADYFDQIYTAGEQNGTRCFIFWNYDHQGSSAPQTPDQPMIGELAIGDDVILLNNNQGMSIQDTGTGANLFTGLTQSYDVDAVSSPVLWATIQRHAARPGSATAGSTSTNAPAASTSVSTTQAALAGVTGS